MKRPFLLYVLLLLHVVLAAGALYGGWKLLTDPIGFGMRPEWLDHSPFHSYTAPGIVLLLLLGIFPLIVARGLMQRSFLPFAYVFNIYRDRHWAWTYSLIVGLILIGWINVQIALVPYFWMQPLFLGWGLAIVVLTMWPSVMRFYQKNSA